MPTLKIQSNAALDAAARAALLADASRRVSQMLGKAERYAMVLFEPTPSMCLGGSDAPLAYLELKSLGLPQHRTAEFSAALCALVATHLGVGADRVYIEFSAPPPPHLFGFNAGTF